ncbi:MAG: EamA family transporter [Gemmatimonadota bacterium]|nr:EamA family transporter [Gemmatimonadota bacterium]MDH5196063.1 EamA family transporter [Gemmatimonadota bacterium]
MTSPTPLAAARLRQLQAVGVLSGFAAGAWLGAAEAPTKVVTLGISPVAISFVMVFGVFLARWSLPALIRGTANVGVDVRRAPHLVVWALIAGCLWAVANTLTIFAIRDIGLSIAFPLWNTNSLLGIVWGAVLFNELRGAGRTRWLAVAGGATVMFGGALLLALASPSQAGAGNAFRGMAAAIGAGVLWGTMYIPYRKAYLTGMNPLSFVTFFTIGELGLMTVLAFAYLGGPEGAWQELARARGVLFWLLLGGFVWVVGDLFQQYAAKYIGIGRGIPLSNTNQLWGLLWGILVFGELAGGGSATYAQVVGGSLIMALGAGAIALATAPAAEHLRWQEAAQREAARYGVDPAYVGARLAGEDPDARRGRTIWDWIIVGAATAVFVVFATTARAPQLAMHHGWVAALALALLVLLGAGGAALWRTTRFG